MELESEAETVTDVDVGEISPQAWRLLRVAAGYEQRGVEREIDSLLQAHVSMLESDARSLSEDRLLALLDLYATNLDDEQMRVLIDHF